MDSARALLVVHAAATLYMCGVIWFVQVVHYPLFAAVGADGFAGYETAHARLTTWVVMPPMVIELLTAFLLVVRTPDRVGHGSAWLGLVLVGAIWTSTFFLQVPQHGVLSAGFDAHAHRLLVSGNWVRTVAWTLRAGLACWMLARALP